MESAQVLCERLRERGYVVTSQRRTICQVLEGNCHHPSAEQVHVQVRQRLPEVSLATIYKTLKELVAMGELRELRVGGERCHFDPNVSDHAHLCCDTCGSLVDVEVEAGNEPSLQVQRQDFVVSRVEVIYHGTCGDCVRRSPETWRGENA